MTPTQQLKDIKSNVEETSAKFEPVLIGIAEHLYITYNQALAPNKTPSWDDFTTEPNSAAVLAWLRCAEAVLVLVAHADELQSEQGPSLREVLTEMTSYPFDVVRAVALLQTKGCVEEIHIASSKLPSLGGAMGSCGGAIQPEVVRAEDAGALGARALGARTEDVPKLQAIWQASSDVVVKHAEAADIRTTVLQNITAALAALAADSISANNVAAFRRVEEELAATFGTPCALACEHAGCTTTADVADYVRLESDLVEDEEDGPWSSVERDEWRNEAIALCPAHAGGRKRYSSTSEQ